MTKYILIDFDSFLIDNPEVDPIENTRTCKDQYE